MATVPWRPCVSNNGSGTKAEVRISSASAPDRIERMLDGLSGPAYGLKSLWPRVTLAHLRG